MLKTVLYPVCTGSAVRGYKAADSRTTFFHSLYSPRELSGHIHTTLVRNTSQRYMWEPLWAFCLKPRENFEQLSPLRPWRHLPTTPTLSFQQPDASPHSSLPVPPSPTPRRDVNQVRGYDTVIPVRQCMTMRMRRACTPGRYREPCRTWYNVCLNKMRSQLQP